MTFAGGFGCSKVFPIVFDFIRSIHGIAPMREITAGDMLGRKAVEIDREACSHVLAGKGVLVTGAASSIGGELCRHVIAFAPGQLFHTAKMVEG